MSKVSRTALCLATFLLAIVASTIVADGISSAEADEVILTFELSGDHSDAQTILILESESGTQQTLKPGQHATVREGEAIELTLKPGTNQTFVRWEGSITGGAQSATYEFYSDSILRAVVSRHAGELPTAKVPSTESVRGSMDNRTGISQGLEPYNAVNSELTMEPQPGAKTLTEIWVDFAYVGVEVGSETNPFDTIGEGASAGAILGTTSPPGVVKIRSGFTPQTLRIEPIAPIRLQAPNGPVRIGINGVSQYFTVSATVSGSGTVSGVGAYLPNTNASIGATSSPGGWAFSHWLGDLTGFTNPTSLTVDSNKSVMAVFVQNPASLLTTSATLDGGGALPTQVLAGDAFTVAWVISNNGTNPATSGDTDWKDSVFLSRDAAIGFDDKNLNATGYTHSGTLSAGNFYTATVSIVIPDVSPGAYYLLFRSDVELETIQTGASRAAGAFAHALTISDPELKP